MVYGALAPVFAWIRKARDLYRFFYGVIEVERVIALQGVLGQAIGRFLCDRRSENIGLQVSGPNGFPAMRK